MDSHAQAAATTSSAFFRADELLTTSQAGDYVITVAILAVLRAAARDVT